MRGLVRVDFDVQALLGMIVSPMNFHIGIRLTNMSFEVLWCSIGRFRSVLLCSHTSI